MQLTSIVALALVCALPHSAFAACAKPAFTAAQGKTISTRSPNQGLFSSAVLVELNHVRCQKNLRQLTASAGLTKVAATHAAWMARARKLSHRSTVAGQSSLKPRIKSAGVSFKTAAENIAFIDRYRLGRQPFRVISAANCRFRDGAGKPIAAHSYASLARNVVAEWMASSGHRKNLLNRRMKMMGAGLAFDGKSPHCGRFFISQDFAG